MQRTLLSRPNVEQVLRIKHLLYEKRFTIEGARQSLQSESPKSRGPRDSRETPKQQASLFTKDPLPEIRKRKGAIVNSTYMV